ncbi:hypothetical protein HRE53_30035 (plasmid) [Acaryochloris sp. 'Moss Beach']|uniref:hypothetical protein n=1 Tax=Acaryochloris sp. 'Moss Beach' TaxID=2740837 RepID=UPI001F1A03DB|nr:hypothetical protein [Acaryochloris sp. 'Moss Beach']UJB72974.1 hypothetical protein HRE53_30035 [Acaryochloris sp. 'Moss Beach']
MIGYLSLMRKKSIKYLWEESQSNITTIITSKHLPKLKKNLASKKFGKVIGSNILDYENQFSKGGLQSTYSILMRQDGLYADTNDDGQISNFEEAEKNTL